MLKKYPVGTTIIFKPSVFECDIVKKDANKIGRIVGISSAGHPLIVLPESTHESDHSTKKCFVTWKTGWLRIVPVEKNQQLLFPFME